MIPYCDDDAPGSEKKVFERLKEDPDTTAWTVLYSVGLARRRSGPYGEIDFVAIIPREGIVCLEVKGAVCPAGKESGGLWMAGGTSTNC